MAAMSSLNPGLILILGALAVPVLPGWLRRGYMLLLPVSTLASIAMLEPGSYGAISFVGFNLETLRVDALARVFGIIFAIAAFLSVLYALHDDDRVQQTAALIYAGSAIAAVFAGDLITLAVFWELTAISSVFLIWARRTDRAYWAGMRYLVIQVGAGVLLVAGVLVHVAETGSLAFDHLGIGTIGTGLIFVAFGIKCAFPLLHNWLQDAYPEATVSGTVWLSSFTTKLAVYALARGFAGTELLIWIGAVMALFPVFYALMENDLRRVLAYSLNDQLGFIVVAIGIGTELALNGAAAHAAVQVLCKALLFMSIGAVLLRTGTAKATELGGLYRSMPLTAGFCIVGALSISAFPLFSAFVTKSMIQSSVAEEGILLVWLTLQVASVGVVLYAGLKVPLSAFFGPDRGLKCREAPVNMIVAMAITAFLCLAIGIYPAPLFALLPFPVDYHAYTFEHVVTKLQLFAFAALAFLWVRRSALYPTETRSVILDFDIVYRKGMPAVVRAIVATLGPLDRAGRGLAMRSLNRFMTHAQRHTGPSGALSRTAHSGNMVLWVILLLATYLLVYLVQV